MTEGAAVYDVRLCDDGGGSWDVVATLTITVNPSSRPVIVPDPTAVDFFLDEGGSPDSAGLTITCLNGAGPGWDAAVHEPAATWLTLSADTGTSGDTIQVTAGVETTVFACDPSGNASQLALSVDVSP